MSFVRSAPWALAIVLFLGLRSLLPGDVNGAQPRSTGGPFPAEMSCMQALCHLTFPVNSGSGGIFVTANGQPLNEYRYTPGERVAIVVRGEDPDQRRWGFQVSARPESNGCVQAGQFELSPNDPMVRIFTNRPDDTPPGCLPATIQFPTHTFPKSAGRGESYQVDWVAAAQSVGNIVFAAAWNAANGNNLATLDRIYTTAATIAPADLGPMPSINDGGIVNSAAFHSGPMAPGAIVSIFGISMAADTVIADEIPLPTELAGTTVEVIDVNDVARPAALFFVSPNQINCQIPVGTAFGDAALKVRTPAGESTLALESVPVSAGFFAANATGSGVAAAAAVRVDSEGGQTQVEVLDLTQSPIVGKAINLGPEAEQVVVLLFGTGFRNFQGVVEATIGGENAPIVGIGAQPEFVGLDQLNLVIPRALIGRGEVPINVTIDEQELNEVTITVE